MGILKKIAGMFGGGVVDAVEKGADIVERWAPGVEKKAELAAAIDEQIESTINSARSYAAPGMTGGWLGTFADGLSRLIRPVTTTYVLGVVFGLWGLNIPQDMDPWYLVQAERILVFWFGGKFLLKDIPAAIMYLRRGR